MEGKAKDLLLLNALLHLMKELAAQSRVILKKLTVPHLVNKFPVSFLMEPKGSLPCSQKTTTDPYHEPDKIWFTPPHPISSSSILILYFHFGLGFLVYFLQVLPTKKNLHACYMPLHFILLDNPNNIQQGVHANHDASHYLVFSCFLLLLYSKHGNTVKLSIPSYCT